MKVLAAVDGSDPGLRACQIIAELLVQERDTVRLVTVLSYSESPDSGIPGEPLADEAERRWRAEKEVHHITDAARTLFDERGIDVDVVHRFGNVTEGIVEEIDRWHPDLVVMGRRAVHGIERVIGSVSEHVLHHSKVPLLLVP